MSHFIQLHLLTAYPPATLNRDDLGRPKTAGMGGRALVRVASQWLKRTWRTSPVFEVALAGHLGSRTREMGHKIHARLLEGGLSKSVAAGATEAIVKPFGAVETKKKERLFAHK